MRRSTTRNTSVTNRPAVSVTSNATITSIAMAMLSERMMEAVASVTDRRNEPVERELTTADSTPRVRPSVATVSWLAMVRSLSRTRSRAPFASPEAICSNRPKESDAPVFDSPVRLASCEAAFGFMLVLSAAGDDP